MFVQKFFKGIAGIADSEVEGIFRDGIHSNRLRTRPDCPVLDVLPELTEDALYAHVTDYAAHGAQSCFVSLTAGTRDQAEDAGWFRPHKGWDQALRFATRGGRAGVVLEGWVLVMGTQSWHMIGTAEDIRDRHVYPRFNKYWRQGEVTAKVLVPGSQVCRATVVDAGRRPIRTLTNAAAIDPGAMSNVREVI